jgi:phospholipase/carboxylesterase
MSLIESPHQVQIEPEQPATACLIWLHGLGADGYDFVTIEPYLNERLNTRSLRYIFPHAPLRPVTIADGQSMRSWYDIMAMSPKRSIDPDQLANSVNHIYNLIGQQIAAGIPSHRIILAGFSQGGAVAYQAASSFDQPLGALIALSTYIPDASQVNPFEVKHVNRQMPVFIGHGSYDNVVPMSLAMEARLLLESHDLQPQWHTYPLHHEISKQEVDDIARFIRHHLGQI